jgi:hypothetical protein
MRWVLTIAWVSLLGGCAVLPPVRASAGAGGAGGTVVTHSASGRPTARDGAALGELRAAFTPLSLMAEPLERSVDVGVGWGFDWLVVDGEQETLLHGPFADVTWFVRRGAPASHFRWRWGPVAGVEAVVPPNGLWGYGASLGLLGEYVMSDRGSGPGASQHGVFYGGARGELGVGLSLRAGTRRVEGETSYLVVIAVEVRTPGIVGFAIGPTQRRGWVSQ